MLGFEPNKSWLGTNMYKDGEDSVERTRNRSMKIRRRAMRFKSAKNHYGSKSNRKQHQSSKPIHSQFPLFSVTQSHLNVNAVVNLF